MASQAYFQANHVPSAERDQLAKRVQDWHQRLYDRPDAPNTKGLSNVEQRKAEDAFLDQLRAQETGASRQETSTTSENASTGGERNSIRFKDTTPHPKDQEDGSSEEEEKCKDEETVVLQARHELDALHDDRDHIVSLIAEIDKKIDDINMEIEIAKQSSPGMGIAGNVLERSRIPAVNATGWGLQAIDAASNPYIHYLEGQRENLEREREPLKEENRYLLLLIDAAEVTLNEAKEAYEDCMASEQKED